MEDDESAACFDTIVCQSGQFGFFQKRLFFINTLIQSACITVIVYTCMCMPEIDDQENDGCSQGLVFSKNGYHDNLTLQENEDNIVGQLFSTATNASLDYILQNLTKLLPSMTTTSFTHILGNSTNMTRLLDNKSLVNALDMVIGNLTGSVVFLANSSMDDIPEVLLALRDQTNFTTDSILELKLDLNYSKSLASDSLETYINSIFQTIDNISSNTEENVTFTPSHALHLASSVLHPNVTDHNNDWSHLVDTVLVNLTNGASLQDVMVTSLELSEVTSNTTITTPSLHSSYNVCHRPFILFRTDLKRTQILDSMSLDDLIQLNFYGHGVSVIIGSAVGSMVADIMGRRRILYITLAGMLIMHCLLAVSISWLMFIFLRMLAVAFAGATMVVSSVMVIEFLGPEWRDACTCSCFWTFGAIVLSMETLATLNWRWLALLSGGVCLPLIGTYFTSTESVRWLQCQHRFTEAEACFREVVSVNSSTVPDIMSLLDESRACIVHNMHQKRFTFIDLFHSLDSAKWTLALIYTCMVSACVYFCLLLRVKQITGLVHFDVFLPLIIDLPLTWSVIVVNRCLGRRWCLFLYSFASGFALLSVLVLHVTGNLANMPSLVTGLALFGKIGVTASLSLIFLIAIETYPTVTRCMGLAVAMASASGGAMLSAALIFLEQYHYTVPFLVYGAMMASVGAVGLLFPETIRRPLKNVQQCRHRKIPLMEGARLVGRPPTMWDSV